MSQFDIVEKLKIEMKNNGINWYVCDTNDPHCSEYINEHYQIRKFFSGFTGSNGTLIIHNNDAFLWTDGRYFVQAKNELPENISLMKMGEKNVPSIIEFIKSNYAKGECFGFNGELINSSFYEELINSVDCDICLNLNYKPECTLWNDRPEDSCTKAFILDIKYSGETLKSKADKVREVLSKDDIDGLLISKLDDQMWLLNLRGNDIECNPVIYGFTFFYRDEVHFFCKDNSLSDEVKAYLEKNDIILHSYNNVYSYISEILNKAADIKILSDKRYLNCNLYNIIKNSGVLIDSLSPTDYLKSIKNETEILNTKKTYLLDSVQVTKFIKYVKENAGKGITEISAANKLDSMRMEIEGFIELSFPTISAYGANAAMMHYEPSEDNPVSIMKNGLYLVDSGGQYLGGTTDVTRTIVVGEITKECKKDYTLSVCGNLRLLNAVFMKGCTGRNLDILAREPLWKNMTDYKCGTGHGIGFALNVHEGPQNIGWQKRKNGIEAEIKPGMIISDEPGVYKAGEYGIRIETILLCNKMGESSDGEFLSFEPLTFVPIDRAGMEPCYMTSEDIAYYNSYQELVYKMISPYLDDLEKEWLKNETLPI